MNRIVQDRSVRIVSYVTLTTTQQQIIIINVQKHLFTFEADVASKAIIEKRNEALPPAMTWNDTLGNLKTLDLWRKEVGYRLPQDK